MIATLKVAAAVVAAGGLLLVARPPRATAFEEVARKLHEAHTIVYRATSTLEDVPGAATPMKLRLFYRVPGLMRVETDIAGAAAVSILDGTRSRMVMLDAAKKSAIVLENVKPPEDLAAQTVEELRNLPGKDGKPVGRERIGDVEAEGYRVEERGGTIVTWIDPKTRLPVRIDVDQKVADQRIRATLTDFQLDPPLDDALFRADPPEGYAVQTMNGGAMFDKPEAAVVRVLRAFAEHNGGAFPTRLDDIKGYKSLESAFPKKKEGEKPSIANLDPKALELAMSLGRVMVLRQELKGYGYKADGVKLGDAGKAIFWYKPDGSEKYRAVYGDLHIGDVAADALPEQPKP
jgi:outer membrane lipoprotein-sorting protein